jgi:hypothetical protein
MRAPARVLLLLSALSTLSTLSIGCGPAVDLTKGLQVLQVSGGWRDAGIVNGNNKLVPSVTFQLHNVSDQTLGTLQVNVTFHRVNEKDEWGSGFKTITGSEGLAAGATTPPITVTSQLGYTGSEPRLQIMKNSRFVDAIVVVFAKYGSIQWTRLGEYPITRQLLTP